MSLNRTVLAILFAAVLAAPTLRTAFAQEKAPETDPEPPPQLKWSFAGPLGKYDTAQLQRGFKVYKEVCSNCHSLKLVAFRNLADPGGPGFSEAQAKAVAADYKVPGPPDDQGQPTERTAQLFDYFPPKFPNEQAARAIYGAAPPDMSVLAKARTYERGLPWFIFDIFTQYQEQGPDYIAAMLKGYVDPPPQGAPEVPSGAFYNKYFPGRVLRMPPPLVDGQVTYDDGTPGTVDQYARDVAAFLMWTAEPTLTARKRIGLQVMVFLIVFAGLLYFAKKRVWHEVELHPEDLKDRPAGPGEYGSRA
jgi:ubiquinol-cytochrome c reductase cytochrome b/c1 subunit